LSENRRQPQFSSNVANTTSTGISSINGNGLSETIDTHSLDGYSNVESDCTANDEASRIIETKKEYRQAYGIIEESTTTKATVEDINLRLHKLKNTIVHPSLVKIKDDDKQYMDLLSHQERTSHRLKSLSKENSVPKKYSRKDIQALQWIFN
jgi:hypothetical protein